MLIDYFLVWQGNGIYHHLGKFWSEAVKWNKIFISKNWVWKTYVSPLVKGGCKVGRKQDWRVYVFIICSCVTLQQQEAERRRMPAAMPKAKSLWVSDRSKPGVHPLDLNTQHLYTPRRRRDKPRKDSSLGEMKRVKSKESWEAAESRGVFTQACWPINLGIIFP